MKLKEILKEFIKYLIIFIGLLITAFTLDFILLNNGIKATEVIFLETGIILWEIKYWLDEKYKNKKYIKLNGFMKFNNFEIEPLELGKAVKISARTEIKNLPYTEEIVEALKDGKEIEMIIKK